MALPLLPEGLRPALDKLGLSPLWGWWQAFSSFMTNRFATKSDITVMEAGKGIVLTSPDGTKTKRVRLSNDGTSLVIEDV